MKFLSLCSGSSGNCYYLGDGNSGIIIDAGIGSRILKKHLTTHEIPVKSVKAILITHCHQDHARGIQSLSRKFHIPVFTTEKVWKSIYNYAYGKDIDMGCTRYILPFEAFRLAEFEIVAFPVFHDTPETLGFHIKTGNRKITIVTDLGHLCQHAKKYIDMADFLVIESNYDKDMLENGRYPEFLKTRIMGNNGHLDNFDTASYLATNLNPELTDICLAHLSKDNNTPELALETLRKAFADSGRALNGKPNVMVLERNIPSMVVDL